MKTKVLFLVIFFIAGCGTGYDGSYHACMKDGNTFEQCQAIFGQSSSAKKVQVFSTTLP